MINSNLDNNEIEGREQEVNIDLLSSSFFTGKKLLGLLGIGALIFFFLVPIGKLIYLSLQSKTGISFGSYVEIFQQARTWRTLKDTLIIVLGSTFLSVLLGIMTAWLMAYTDIKHKKKLHMAMLLSFILPSYVLTLSWASFMGTQGGMAYLLKLFKPDAMPWSMYSYGGIIFVMGIHHFPLVYMLTVDVLKRIPRDLEWASKASGAGKVKTFFFISFPMALPGLIGGGLLAFLAGLDNFGIPAFLGIPVNISVLSTLIYEEIIGFGPTSFARGAVLSVLLGVFAVVGTFLQWLAVRKVKISDTAIIDDNPRYQLGRYRKWMSALLWSFLTLITVVPLLSMFVTSLKKAYGLPFKLNNLTFSHYRYILFENPKVWQSIQNSLMLSITTLVLCLVLGTWFAYVRVRKPSWLTKTAEIMIGIPFALPGIVFALSMIFTWMEPIPGWKPGIYGTVRILFIAYVCRFLILQVRTSMTAFVQIDGSMEEAAHIFGANGWKKWTFVLLPLLVPGLLSGAFLVFLTALTELTVSALLWSSGSQTIGVTIFSFEQAGNTEYSTALSCLIVGLIVAGMGVLQAVQRFQVEKGARS